MGDQPATRATERQARKGVGRRRRVLIGDVRHNGNHLRTTWHAEDRMFVVSTWNGELCTGAIRVPVDEAAELAGLLVDGLAEAATAPQPAPQRSASSERSARRSTVGRELQAWLRQGRRLLGALSGRPSGRRSPGRAATGLSATLTSLTPRDQRRTA